jgi:hypothetical protein
MSNHDQLRMLVAEIAAFLESWQQRLSAGAPPEATQAKTSGAQAERLRQRAAELGIGGLVHHFDRHGKCLQSAPVDPLSLRDSLRAISEITWQLRQELTREQAARPAAQPAQRGEPQRPPHLTGDASHVAGSLPVEPARSASGRASDPLLARSLAAPPLISSSLVARVQGTESIEAPAVPPPPPLEVPRLVSPRAAPESIPASPLPPAQQGPSRPPAGLLGTLFGLRAFGQATRGAARAHPAREANVLGLRQAAPARSALAPPPLISGRGGLPPLASAISESAVDARIDADLEARLRQIRRRSSALPSSAARGAEQHSAGPGSAPLQGLRRAARIPWGLVLLLTIPAGVLLGNAFLMLDRRLRAGERAPEAATLALEPAPPVQEPSVAATPANPAAQQLQELVAQLHGFGGEESPELAALLNAEANAAAQAVSQSCEAGNSACESQRLARDLLTPRPLARREHPSGPPPRWLTGLKIPAIGAQDQPEVRRWVEYYTSHSVGRELFQTMLFRCGAEQDLINAALVHHGLPLDLLAVVLTESACVPNAESAVGARGLWQFMPSTARAYHLYVQEGVVDERLSPVKSTEAALRYLGDLYRKMQSWEMAFASYNAGSGPFRMLARLRQAGGAATFWDLVDAQLIPEETARYVPRIQAYAVILANLRHFDFSAAQMRTAEETADLEVPSRARLGQVARAAGTSVAYLRSLNPDLVGTVIPDLPNARFVLQVPKAAVFRARETLEQFLHEQLDSCVSSAFDWGRERFTAEMQAQCAARRSK